MTPPTAFLLPPDWTTGIEMSSAWLTDILPGENGAEMRISQRDAPAETIKYTARLLTAADVGGLAVLLAQAPTGRVNMPRWPDASLLTADVAIGGTSIACDTTDRGFAVGDYALIWKRTSGVFEVRTIAGVADDALDITGDAATLAWTGNTDVEVLPIAPAILTLPMQRTYIGGVLADVQIDAEWEAAPLPTTGPTTSVAVTVVIVFDFFDNDYFNQGAYIVAHAEVLDADGIEIPEAPVTWTTADATIATVQKVGLYGQTCIIRKVDAFLFTNTDVTATSGAASTTVPVES
jgi:hypothetical protein